MRKKIFSFLVLLTIVIGTYAQSENVATASLSFKTKVGSALEYVGGDKVYKVLLPDEPTVKGKPGKFGLFASGFGLDAKRAKGEEGFYKSFRVISSGMKAIIREEDERKSSLAGSGFVKRIYFNFPLSIEVSNAAGQVEKTFEVVSEKREVSEVFHANWKQEGAFVDKVPFATQEEMNRQYAENHEAILAKIERDAIQNTLYPKAKSVVNAAYGSNKYSGGFLYIYTPSKSATNIPADLTTYCNDLKSALIELNDKAKEPAALQKIEAAYTYFNGGIASDNPTLAQLYLGNTALSALVTGHLKEAEDSFSKFYLQFSDLGKNKALEFSGYFELLHDVYNYYYTIKQSTQPTISFTLRPRGFDDKNDATRKQVEAGKMAAEAEAKASRLPVFNGEEGIATCIDKNKKEFQLKGGIFYDFNATTVKKDGIQVSSPLKVKTREGQIEEVPTLSVLHFVVDGKKYLSTSIKGGDLFKVAAIAAGKLDATEFWEVLQEDPDKAIYLQRVGRDEFAITKSAYLEAVSVADIIKKRKPAKDFLEQCPLLAQAIDSKQITEVKTRDDFKKFYKWIQENCK